MDLRSKLFALNLAFILLFVNSQIYLKEKQIAEGRVVLLTLAPVDPRSLMQGDYMILAYELADQIPGNQSAGLVYLKIDSKGLAESLSHSYEPETVPLRFRIHQDRAVFGIESYLFQEGMAELYQRGKYAELRVTKDGVPHLIRLLDENFQPLGDEDTKSNS